MRILYNLAFIIFGILYLPYLVVTKRYRYGMGNRFGILSGRLKNISSKAKVIWIHAVSVGEMKAASILAPILRKSFPSHTLLFSSVTHTGNKIARTIATGAEEIFYLPFDISFIVDKVVSTIKPELFLCMETEIWPNLIDSLYRHNVKIVLVNGRISDKSYTGYRKVSFIVSGVLKKFSLILMQSEKDKARILDLGAPKEKLYITGNLKFDLSLLESGNKRREIREKLSISEKGLLLIAGSTHKGEEEEIVECFSKLKREYGNLSLLIAPRHIERTQEVARLLDKSGFKPIRISQISMNTANRTPITESCVYLLDTIGELKDMYSASDIVFVGGSLVKKGGQNPIEPASLSKPIIIGRFTFNFHDAVKTFLENDACIQIGHKDELYPAIKALLDSPVKRKSLGMNAKGTVDKNSGSSQRTRDLILSIYSG